MLLFSAAATGSLASSADRRSDQIVALERAALDRWINFDPQGYLELYAPGVTYFNPFQEKRVDGAEAMRTPLEPIAKLKGAPGERRYEMLSTKVQHQGDTALLTFQLISYAKPAGGPEAVMARWNSTEVYRRIAGQWRIIHNHWSFTKPDLKKGGA